MSLKSNCLVFAVLLYSRRNGRRWYIKARKSDHGWFPHFLIQAGHHVISYTPINPRHKTFPPPFFDGRVKWGD